MIGRYGHKNNSKSEPDGIKFMINGGTVTFEKHKTFLKLSNAIIMFPIKSVLMQGKRLVVD